MPLLELGDEMGWGGMVCEWGVVRHDLTCRPTAAVVSICVCCLYFIGGCHQSMCCYN